MSADLPRPPTPPAVAAALATIARSQPADYDGHTEFERLSPSARLAWMEAAVRFLMSRRSAKTSLAGANVPSSSIHSFSLDGESTTNHKAWACPDFSDSDSGKI